MAPIQQGGGAETGEKQNGLNINTAERQHSSTNSGAQQTSRNMTSAAPPFTSHHT